MATVERIIIKIGDKEIPLTVNEAKELQQVLSDMFGDKVTIVSPPSVVPYPVP